MGSARSGFLIGRLFGIDIFIDWSWLFIFVLVTWNLGTGFMVLHPSWGWGLAWGLAVVGALLFFASVLAHELAHWLVARARGLPVRDITLFIFGGVSTIQREPPTPWVEFVVAIVGPLTSLAIGTLLTWAGAVTASGVAESMIGSPASLLDRLAPLASLLLYLGPLNIMLGLFNLIPGFPLDGGRVLRAALWGATHDVRRATRWASLVGQVVGWMFIIAGLATFFGVRIPLVGGFVGGLWLAFIGWFLQSAATQSYRQVVVQDLLRGVTVASLMRPSGPAAAPTTSVATLVHDYVMGTDERAFPMVRGDVLVGLICLDDVRKVPRQAWGTTTVGAIMTPVDRLTTVGPGDEAGEALRAGRA
jgi:Zn-dependent protease